MKKFVLYALVCCLTIMSSQIFAQAVTACNNKTAPEVTSGTYATAIGGSVWTPAPTLDVTAVGLANTEYLIVKKGQCALDSAGTACDTTAGGGDVIIGGDADGIFDAGTISRYGYSIAPGDTFGIVAVGYDLTQVKGLVDDILNGTTLIGAPCCSIFDLNQETAGFCDTLGVLGISGPNDVTGIEDVLTVFDAFANAELSVNSLISYMSTVNGYGTLLSTSGCGTTTDGQLICYGLNPSQAYYYVAANNVSVEQFESLKGFGVYPNPSNGLITLDIDTEKAMDLTVNIYNAFGQKVNSQQLNNVDGAGLFTANLSDFAAGIYMVELTDGTNSATTKLIIQ